MEGGNCIVHVGGRAYCCQCKWVSMRPGTQPTPVNAVLSAAGEPLRWVCAKKH